MSCPPRKGLSRAGLLAAVLATLGGCASRAPGGSRDAAALTACRRRADEIYSKQNRAELYRSDVFATSSRDAPFATTGLPGITSRGLGGAFARDNLVSDCLAQTRPGPAVTPANAGGGEASPNSTPPSQLP